MRVIVVSFPAFPSFFHRAESYNFPSFAVILTYTTVSDIKGNDITTLYPAMITAAQTQIQSKENGNVPIEFWTRSKTPLVLKDKTGKKALEWTWSDIADIDLSLENDSQVWNGSRSYGNKPCIKLLLPPNGRRINNSC